MKYEQQLENKATRRKGFSFFENKQILHFKRTKVCFCI